VPLRPSLGYMNARIKRPPNSWDAEAGRARRPKPGGGACSCSWRRIIICAILLEVALALLATVFLDWPVSDTGTSPPPLPSEPEPLPRQLAVRLRVDQTILHRLPPRVQACVSLDWWPADKCDYGDCPWRNASLLTVDLSDPLLHSAIRALSPVALRVGGSLADQVT
jgi:hypothetical protein